MTYPLTTFFYFPIRDCDHGRNKLQLVAHYAGFVCCCNMVHLPSSAVVTEGSGARVR